MAEAAPVVGPAGIQVQPKPGASATDLEVLRHSTAHVMAQAVKRLFPEARLAIGPAIENGFYYDFDLGHSLTTADLDRIEVEMCRIVAEDLPIMRSDKPAGEVRGLFERLGEPYKVELIDDIANAAGLPGEAGGMEGPVTVSLYAQGEFVDLCRGPHLGSTGKLGAFKLLNVAGAYWRGDEKRKMLQRVYGTAFPSKNELDGYLHMLEEAARRDHRRLGKELDLFSIHEEAGAGLIFYHPKGTVLRSVIEDFARTEHTRRGYQQVMIPHISDSDLWRTSGHYDYYLENMYLTQIEGKEYVIKPMNCPGHILIYKTQTRSYRDLPVRYFELGTVYRYERSGVLHGLLRVRGFTQDDAHIFCRPDQLTEEVIGVIDFAFYMLRSFGFKEYEVWLSTKPEKAVGDDAIWERATQALVHALREHDVDYLVDEGGGAFYGPKIDIKLKDALGRAWQGPTIQMDFNLPERFDVTYIGQDGAKHRPAMIHRTVLGSMERFIGVLVEHYAGAFPVWLAPVQATIIPVVDKNSGYARDVRDRLLARGVRCEADARGETLGYKVRDARNQRVPYILVVGDREEAAGQVSVRSRSAGEMGAVSLSEFGDMVLREASELK